MTKSELVEKIADIYQRMDNLETNFIDCENELKKVKDLMEDLPENPDEITEDEKDE